MMIVFIKHDFLFVVTYQSVINSIHCSYDNSIMCFQSVQIIYRHVIAIYHQDFLFFEDSKLCKIISKAQSLYIKKRLANAVQKNITDFFNAK